MTQLPAPSLPTLRMRTGITLMSLVLAAWTALSGQTRTAQASDDDLIIDLPEFRVEVGESGKYVATNSNSGTRLNQRIKELPIPVEIITAAFIEDTGALTLEEALQFTAGLETEILNQQSGENPGDTGFRLRGFVSEAALRNGFRRLGQTDTINIAQVDVVRGPNALLYGIGNFGGVVNYVTKMPLSEFQASVNLTAGSWDFTRVGINARGPINEKIGYTISGLKQTGDTWYDHGASERTGFSPLIEFKPLKKTNIVIEWEYLRNWSKQPENPLTDSFLVSAKLDERFVDTRFYPQIAADGETATNQGFLRYPSREFRYNGQDTERLQKDTGLLLMLDQGITENLAFQFGYYYSKRDVFSQNNNLQVGSLNPLQNPDNDRLRREYGWAYNPLHPDYEAWHTGAANNYLALRYDWEQERNIQTRDQMRAEFAYQANVLRTRHTFLLGGTVNQIGNQPTQFRLKDTARPGQGITASDTTGFQNAFTRWKAVADYVPISLEPGPDEVFMQLRQSFVENKVWEKGAYLIHQGNWFKEKLVTVAGLRYDWIHTANAQRDRNTAELLGYTHRADGPSTDFNLSFGAAYTFNPQFSAYYLTASALEPIYNQSLADGLIPEPVSGVSQEIGLKWELWEGKVSGALAIYQLHRDGVVINAGATPFENDSRSDRPDPDWIAEGRGISRALAMKEDESRGLDLQLWLSDFVPGFQTIINFSYNEYEWIRTYGPSFVRKLSPSEAEGGSVFLFEDRDFSSSTIDPNKLNNDTPKYAFRLWNKYTFRSGFMEGFEIGLGYRWSSEREAQFSFFESISYKTVPELQSWDLAFGYKREFAAFTADLRVNIYNLANDDTVYGYSYTTPLHWRARLSINF